MDVVSYLLGKKAGGGGGGGTLQEKTITITEDGTTVLTPDTGYDGFSKVTINTEVGGGGLPAEYQQVEYIRSTGTQYINTGVNANSELKIDINLIATEADAKGLYGGGIGWQNSYIQGECDHVSYFAYAHYTNPIYTTFVFPAEVNVVQDKNVISIDGSVKYTFGYVQFITGIPLVLFAVNRNNEISEYGTYDLKTCKIYNAGILARDFVPCYRKSDGEIGLYDLVTETFYTNAGTGTFIKGSNV